VKDNLFSVGVNIAIPPVEATPVMCGTPGNLNRFNRFAVIITFANSHFVGFNLVNFSVGMPLNMTVSKFGL
jgi:hypothetical protein